MTLAPGNNPSRSNPIKLLKTLLGIMQLFTSNAIIKDLQQCGISRQQEQPAIRHVWQCRRSSPDGGPGHSTITAHTPPSTPTPPPPPTFDLHHPRTYHLRHSHATFTNYTPPSSPTHNTRTQTLKSLPSATQHPHYPHTVLITHPPSTQHPHNYFPLKPLTGSTRHQHTHFSLTPPTSSPCNPSSQLTTKRNSLPLTHPTSLSGYPPPSSFIHSLPSLSIRPPDHPPPHGPPHTPTPGNHYRRSRCGVTDTGGAEIASQSNGDEKCKKVMRLPQEKRREKRN